MAPSVKKPSAQARKQQSTAAANGSPERQPPKGKQNAPATESTEQAPLPKRSPRKHVGSPGPVPVPRSSKRAKTQNTRHCRDRIRGGSTSICLRGWREY